MAGIVLKGISRVIMNLVERHGVSRGIQSAKTLGFNKTQIDKAFRQFGKPFGMNTKQVKSNFLRHEQEMTRGIAQGRMERAAQRRDMLTFGERKAYRAAMVPRNRASGRFRETVEDRRLRQARGPEDATELY